MPFRRDVLWCTHGAIHHGGPSFRERRDTRFKHNNIASRGSGDASRPSRNVAWHATTDCLQQRQQVPAAVSGRTAAMPLPWRVHCTVCVCACVCVCTCVCHCCVSLLQQTVEPSVAAHRAKKPPLRAAHPTEQCRVTRRTSPSLPGTWTGTCYFRFSTRTLLCHTVVPAPLGAHLQTATANKTEANLTPCLTI